jgi:predicted dehydrogenase
MSDRVRIAILGPGDVASRDYLPEFHRLEDRAEIVAVCGRGEGRARAIAGRLGVPWFTDQSRMNDDIEIDATVNLTPIQAHEETTRTALEAGHHVYSEKPLAMSVAAATELSDLARGRGLVLVAAPSVLLFPQVREAGELVASGEIGAVHTVRGLAYGGVPPWPGYDSDPTAFFAPGAGPLVDLGVYPLHAITGLLGPARRVSAMSIRSADDFEITDGPLAGRRIPIEVDDAWTVALELGERTLGTVEANFTSHGTRAGELELMGERGTISLDLLDVAAPVQVLDASGEWREIAVDPERPDGGPDHVLGVAHLVECIGGRRTPIASADHAIHVLQIIEAAGVSAASGAAVPIGGIFTRELQGRDP